MAKIFGYGTNQKVITLNAIDTMKYLCIQVLDIIHDSQGNDNQLYGGDIDYVIDLMLFWLFHNNKVLIEYNVDKTNLKNNIKQIIDNMINIEDFMRRHEQFGQLYTNFSDLLTKTFIKNKYSSIQMMQRPKARVLIDNCSNNSSIFCTNKFDYGVFTQSVLYDNGAYELLCKQQESIITNYGTPQYTSSSLEFYYNQDSIKAAYNTISINRCLKKKKERSRMTNKTITDIRDYYLIGTYKTSSAILNFVLAFRGAKYDNSNGGIIFISKKDIYNNSCPNIARGFSPSAKDLNLLHKIISNKTDLNDNDKLLVYCELASKHWGDLGLIFDIVNTDAYLIAQDKILRYLCVLLEANYSEDNRLYIKPDNNQRTQVTHYDNASSWF